MTSIPNITSSTRPSSPAVGTSYFETDTGNFIIWNGSGWNTFESDGQSFGANSYSLDLDGTDDRVELGDISQLNSTSAFSISFWLKVPSSAPSPTYFYQSGTDTFYNAISFYQGSSLDFIIGKSGTAYAGTRYSGSIKDDAWHHLVGVYNGSTMTIYLDGSIPSQSGIGTSVPSSTLSTGGSNPHIGSKTDDTADMQGKIDDFAIFDLALTASEVTSMYSNGVYNAAKLIHLYRFENNYNDSKGSLNGTAQGNPTFNSSDKPY